IALLGHGKRTVHSVRNDVFDAEQFRVTLDGIVEQTLMHFIAERAAIVLRDDLDFRIVLREMDAAEMQMRMAHGPQEAVGGLSGMLFRRLDNGVADRSRDADSGSHSQNFTAC